MGRVYSSSSVKINAHRILVVNITFHRSISYFYNGVKLATTLLEKNITVGGTMKANRDIPPEKGLSKT
jgi:hypothetical protein